MESKHKVYNLIILDESGSMESIRKTIINGFNEVVQTIKGIAIEFPEQEHYVTMITFNSLGIKTILDNEHVASLHEIDERIYCPNHNTPLFDAMGFGINGLRKITASETEYNVLVTILTDGEENASKEYNGSIIKALVEELKLANWTFTYIGANHDVQRFADSISINNSMRFETNDDDLQRMFNRDRDSRMNYSMKIRNKSSLEGGYFDEDDSVSHEPVEAKAPETKSFWKKIFGKG